MRRWQRLSALVVAATAVLSACGVQPDSAPRDVPEDNRPQLGGQSSGSAASGADRIFLVGPGGDGLLRSVPREASSPEDLIRILFRGPNQAEADAQYASVIPADLELLSARTQGEVLNIDVTQQLTNLSGALLVQALAQIVYTASELEGIAEVQVLVDGEPQAWPRADLDFTTGALSTYDYPGMVRSAQPAYPSVPSA